jgi:hypothetical protein
MEKDWKDCIEYIDELSLVKGDWESGDEGVSPYSLDTARELITKLYDIDFSQAPFISPIPDGSIQLDWTFGSNCVEVLIPPYEDESINLRFFNVEDKDIDFSLDIKDQDALIELLDGWSREENIRADMEWEVLKRILDEDDRLDCQI